jgi:uncharacterized membrane protein YdfJ with MMPL/SSD domain
MIDGRSNTHDRSGAITAIARWSTRHPWRALACWLVFVAACVAALTLTGSKSLNSGATGNSAQAETMLKVHQARPAQSESAYLHSNAVRAEDPAFRAATTSVEGSMERALGGRPTASVADGGHSVLVTGPIGRGFSTDALAAAVAKASSPQITAVLDDNSRDGGNNDLSRAERLSIPVTLLVLLIAFGALVAALVPVLLAATAVVAAFGLMGPISQIFPLDSSVKTVVLLIGMAVGVDYALFYVVRSREERSRGLGSHQALERTARTSGRTVLIAGATVAMAMAGQFAIGSSIFNGIASGTIAVIACAVAGSITVLPALLELLGPRIDRGEIPFLPHLHANTSESRFWPAVVDRALRRPALWAGASLAVLVALAIPAVGLHAAYPSSEAMNPRVSSAVQSQISRDFPGTSTPALVVFSFPANERAQVKQATLRLEKLAAAQGVAHPPFTLGGGRDGRVGTLELPLTGLGDNTASKHSVEKLRSTLIPETLGRLPGVQAAITGDTARDLDFTHKLMHGLPYVIAFVLALAFLILLLTFRSLVIPIKAIVLNLLSVAASYGVLVLVFQRHWAESILGFHSVGSIIAWLPVFLFVVLFGLSMDYHVFILSRVREGVNAGMSTDDALRHGITRTAGVVTAAALVMVGVFSLFGTASSLDLKQAGVGLAVAVLLDATVIRGVLLPASMKLLGDWNWYLPRWLDWIPGGGLHEPAADRHPDALPLPATD